jgi:hypothetical protein
VELATLQWVRWLNHIRLLEPIGYIPPAEAEANYWRQLASEALWRPQLKPIGLLETGAVHKVICPGSKREPTCSTISSGSTTRRADIRRSAMSAR